MRKVREVLRLHFECGRKQREIARSCAIGAGTVSDYLKRARDAGLDWKTASELSETELENRLFRYGQRPTTGERAAIDFGLVHQELKRTGVTLQLLWVEYQQAVRARGDGIEPYQYSQFCELYRNWRGKLGISLRQVHRAGEKAFIDYSGKRPRIVDSATGEIRDVELFVMTLGASNYTYAEATLTQKLADFVASTVRGFEFFGGVPEVVVPDQLRSAVSGPDRYDPDINGTYLEMAKHYGVAVVPARPGKPRDKAKVESAVLVAQRWILARLRNRSFFSLDDLNRAISELVSELNERPFQKLDGSRKTAFESLDRPALRALPASRYELGVWTRAKVHIDYHVAFDHRFYSVPVALVGVRVEVRATRSVVEIFSRGVRVASHPRSYAPKGTAVTNDEHRPHAHREYGKWPPARLVAWASTLGPNIALVVERMLGRHSRPELAYRPVLGVIRLGDRYGTARLERACERALTASHLDGARYRYIESILRLGLEGAPLEPKEPAQTLPTAHENIRGGDYYETEDTSDHGRNDPEDARAQAHDDGRSFSTTAREPTRAATIVGREARTTH
ncbi:MAG TPA: IS21 family transposase [Polyangiaceae bacterium]|nr:IS21 family transposase [Polyangiaceae bacterium]